jgi:hypothetical protein
VASRKTVGEGRFGPYASALPAALNILLGCRALSRPRAGYSLRNVVQLVRTLPYSRTPSRAASLLASRHPGASVAPTFSPSVRTNPAGETSEIAMMVGFER